MAFQGARIRTLGPSCKNNRKGLDLKSRCCTPTHILFLFSPAPMTAFRGSDLSPGLPLCTGGVSPLLPWSWGGVACHAAEACPTPEAGLGKAQAARCLWETPRGRWLPWETPAPERPGVPLPVTAPRSRPSEQQMCVFEASSPPWHCPLPPPGGLGPEGCCPSPLGWPTNHMRYCSGSGGGGSKFLAPAPGQPASSWSPSPHWDLRGGRARELSGTPLLRTGPHPLASSLPKAPTPAPWASGFWHINSGDTHIQSTSSPRPVSP